MKNHNSGKTAMALVVILTMLTAIALAFLMERSPSPPNTIELKQDPVVDEKTGIRIDDLATEK